MGFILFIGMGVVFAGSLVWLADSASKQIRREHPICDANAVIKQIEEHLEDIKANTDYGEGLRDGYYGAIEIVRKAGGIHE